MAYNFHRCVICGERPASQKSAYCPVCNKSLKRNRAKRVRPTIEKFVVYHGFVVGLVRNGDHKYKGQLLNRSVENLPKSKTINLDQYCDGYTREQVKNLQRSVLKTAHAK